MTGWIRLTAADDQDPICLSVDHIRAVYNWFEGSCVDLDTSSYKVTESVDAVLQKIRLARPTRD